MRAALWSGLGTRMDSALRSVPLYEQGRELVPVSRNRARWVTKPQRTPTPRRRRGSTAIRRRQDERRGVGRAAVAGTPKAFYAEMEETLDGILEAIESLSVIGQEKFGDVAPSFGPMRTRWRRSGTRFTACCQKKREAEPDEGAEAAVSEESGKGPQPKEETPATRGRPLGRALHKTGGGTGRSGRCVFSG